MGLLYVETTTGSQRRKVLQGDTCIVNFIYEFSSSHETLILKKKADLHIKIFIDNFGDTCINI